MNSDTIVHTHNLHKSFGKTPVLQGISTQVKRGEIVGLLGLNGAGKTTLLETLLGFALPESGQVSLFQETDNPITDERIKKRIGFVPQEEELIQSMKGREYLNLISGCYENWDHDFVESLVQSWDVPLNTRIHKLSVGQKQKLSILSAIGFKPELLILDEPVASLDPKARRQFLQTLVELAVSENQTILFSTHIVSDLERVANKVWLLKDGKLLIDAQLDALKESTIKIQYLHCQDIVIPDSVNLISHTVEKNSQTLVISSNDLTNSLPSFSEQPTHRYTISLEELFLEIHS